MCSCLSGYMLFAVLRKFENESRLLGLPRATASMRENSILLSKNMVGTDMKVVIGMVVGTGVVVSGVVGGGGVMTPSSSPLYFEQHSRKASTQLQLSVM